MPFYWDAYEPKPGILRCGTDASRIYRRPATDRIVEWCEENQITPKGHWLICDNFVPTWLPDDERAVMELLEKRIAELALRYGHRIRIWDVANESLNRPRPAITDGAIHDTVLPRNYVLEAFKLAERYFPNFARLIYNDGTNEGFGQFHYDATPLYLFAKDLLRSGARLTDLGLQYHMYSSAAEIHSSARHFYESRRLLSCLDQYQMLGIPSHVSEISLATPLDLPRPEAEEIQAKLLKRLYSTWFSHKGCESITWWNLCDKTAYGSESQYDACLIGADFQPKPSYQMLDQLVNHQWRTDLTEVTDEMGEIEWNGFYGHYHGTIAGIRHPITLSSRGRNHQHIRLQ